MALTIVLILIAAALLGLLVAGWRADRRGSRFRINRRTSATQLTEQQAMSAAILPGVRGGTSTGGGAG